MLDFNEAKIMISISTKFDHNFDLNKIILIYSHWTSIRPNIDLNLNKLDHDLNVNKIGLIYFLC